MPRYLRRLLFFMTKVSHSFLFLETGWFGVLSLLPTNCSRWTHVLGGCSFNHFHFKNKALGQEEVTLRWLSRTSGRHSWKQDGSLTWIVDSVVSWWSVFYRTESHQHLLFSLGMSYSFPWYLSKSWDPVENTELALFSDFGRWFLSCGWSYLSFSVGSHKRPRGHWHLWVTPGIFVANLFGQTSSSFSSLSK